MLHQNIGKDIPQNFSKKKSDSVTIKGQNTEKYNNPNPGVMLVCPPFTPNTINISWRTVINTSYKFCFLEKSCIQHADNNLVKS